jgi:hypothetical protein
VLVHAGRIAEVAAGDRAEQEAGREAPRRLGNRRTERVRSPSLGPPDLRFTAATVDRRI